MMSDYIESGSCFIIYNVLKECCMIEHDEHTIVSLLVIITATPKSFSPFSLFAIFSNILSSLLLILTLILKYLVQLWASRASRVYPARHRYISLPWRHSVEEILSHPIRPLTLWYCTRWCCDVDIYRVAAFKTLIPQSPIHFKTTLLSQKEIKYRHNSYHASIFIH